MKRYFLLALFTLLAFAINSNAKEISVSDLPDEFQKSIPTKLKDNLNLVHIENRCNGCKQWRYIYYYSNDKKEPVKKEIISVKNGYKAMYAYPHTYNFSNTNIEQSIHYQYKNDKRKIIDAIKHEYKRRKEQVERFLKENPEISAKIKPFKAKGKDYIELEQKTYKGYEYISLTENVIGLTSKEISQIHIFVPKKEIIITAYLLNQKKANFTTISYFLKLRRNFIESYIDFLVKENL